MAREVVGGAAEDNGVGNAIRDRVKETATLAGAVRSLGDGAVEEVVESRQRQQHNGPVVQAHGDSPGRGAGEDESRRRENIGGKPNSNEPATDRRGRRVNRLAELAVEHRRYRPSWLMVASLLVPPGNAGLTGGRGPCATWIGATRAKRESRQSWS